MEVLSTIFAYLDLMRSLEPGDWSRLFEELNRVGEMRWRFLEKRKPREEAQRLVERLITQQLATTSQSPLPLEQILVVHFFSATECGSNLITEDCLEFLKAGNCRVFVGTKEPLEGREFWPLKEQHYGTEYEVRRLDIARLKVRT